MEISKIYEVEIDYRMSLKEMVAAGNYSCVSKAINDEIFKIPYPFDIQENVRLALFEIEGDPLTKMALSRMSRQGLHVLDIECLLAFGAKFPDLQRQFPIFALSKAAWGKDPFLCPFLSRNHNGERKLDLTIVWSYDRWFSPTRFLAIRK